MQADMTSPNRKPRKRMPKDGVKSDEIKSDGIKSDDDKSDDIDFAGSDGGHSSSDSDYAGVSALATDLMDLDLPIPDNNKSIKVSSSKGKNATMPAMTQPSIKLPGPPTGITGSSSTSQPAFLFPPYPYPQFPFKYPNPALSSTSIQTISSVAFSPNSPNQALPPTSIQPVSAAASKKRQYDVRGRTGSVAPKKKEKHEATPHKKMKLENSEKNFHSIQPSQALSNILGRDKEKSTADIPKQHSPSNKAVPIPRGPCSLCGKAHEEGTCLLEEEKQMLEYRKMIVNEAGDETPEQQVCLNSPIMSQC
jgi:hypothetical protein